MSKGLEGIAIKAHKAAKSSGPSSKGVSPRGSACGYAFGRVDMRRFLVKVMRHHTGHPVS
jgi:hypothetical protein